MISPCRRVSCPRGGAAINWFNGILTYVMIWWVVLFVVLPWGVRVPDRPEPGHATSAPERPLLWRKAAVTTLIAALLWLAVFAVIENDLIQIR